MARWLIIIGVALVVIGLLWPVLARIGIGHLPGDIHFRGRGWSFYFPITTCIILSAAVTLLFWLFNR
ncbi:MAG TPA: DUF2905 domain-containing protein [Xanthobacteraceae bacterium]|jgi:hypothetical protein|nr:DUF2905 domain-containing protein [Xanthobacteraceae bacterium]